MTENQLLELKSTKVADNEKDDNFLKLSPSDGDTTSKSTSVLTWRKTFDKVI
jgi:hypothetical protein